MELFAQKGGAGAGGAPPPPDADVILGILAVYAVLIAVFVTVGLVIRIFFLRSMSRCFNQISRRNRQMEPGQVWLALIPFFDIVWIIIMVIRLSDSLKDEYYDRGLRGDGDFGKTLGIVYIIACFACGPVALVCFIMYWVKVVGYTRDLASDPGDDEDDRPRKRRSRDDDDDDDDRPRKRR